MSASYIFFVEAKINGKWRCINSRVPHFEKKDGVFEDKCEYRLHETYWNGSRSYFSRAFEKYCELGHKCKFADISPELRDLYAKWCEDELNGGDVFTSYYQPVVLDYNTLISSVDEKKFDHHGLVHKDYIFEYENGDLEEIFCAERDETKDLSPEELKAYEYYEWDSWWDWNWGLKELKRRVVFDVQRFEDANDIFYTKMEYRIVAIGG